MHVVTRLFLFFLLPCLTARQGAQDVRSSVEAQYRRMDARFVAARSLDVGFTHDARMKDLSGQEYPAREEANTLQPLFPKGTAFTAKTTVDSLTQEGGSVAVTARIALSGTYRQKGQPARRAELVLSVRDFWVRQGETWLVRRREMLGARLAVNGEELFNNLAAPELTPEARAAVVREIRERAIPLAATDTSAPLDDLQPFDRIVGDARIVGLGEGSHGAMEFRRMQQRLVQYLVEKKGFTVVALEACWFNPEPVERAVLSGKGSVEDAVAEMYQGWERKEDASLARWVRGYNARRGDRPAVTLTSFDLLATGFSLQRLQRFGAKLGGSDRARLRRLLASLEPDAGAKDLQKQGARNRGRIDRMVAWLDRRRVACERAAGPAEFRRARHAARLLWQVYDTRAGFFWPERDRAMAENVKWMAEEEYRAQKIVLIAHNGHVARQMMQVPGCVGSRLADRYGKQLVVIGLTSYEGAIRVMREGSESQGPVEISVPPARPESAEALFHETGPALFALDFRRLPKDGPLGRWLANPVPHRSIGNTFATARDSKYYLKVALPRVFDSLIFVSKTTPLD